jgi:hypothetical protein
MYVLPCRDHRFGKHAGAFAPAAVAAGRQRFRPIGCCSRHQVRARELGPQSFSRLQLMHFDQGTAVASAPARKPDERTFRFIDGDAGAAKVGDDLAFAQSQMLGTKAVDGRLRGLLIFGTSRAWMVGVGIVRIGGQSGSSAISWYRIIYLYADNEEPPEPPGEDIHSF